MIGAILGYVPFVEPISLFQTWWYLLLIPLALGISIIYKAMRVYDLATFWWQVAVMTIQIVLAMIALAVGLVVLVQLIVPMLPVRS